MLTYVDSPVALAHLFREPRAPVPSFWPGPKVSSRLLEYEIWNRLHAHAGRTAMADWRETFSEASSCWT